MSTLSRFASVSSKFVRPLYPAARKLLAARGYVPVPGARIVEDGMATAHVCHFAEDPRFVEAYDAGKKTGSWKGHDLRWRAYVACWAADKAKDLEGDFVECGVNKGGLAMTVMTYVGFPQLKKRFYLLDTFCGLAEKYISEEERDYGRTGGGYEECYDQVVRRFGAFDNVTIVRGAVPETLPAVKSNKVAYLSIDMNCAKPEIDAAEYFWEKLVPGAVIVLDDYAYGDEFAVQRVAFDEFAKRRGVAVLTLPTGQGLILKP